jgi:hypothetical protein
MTKVVSAVVITSAFCLLPFVFPGEGAAQVGLRIPRDEGKKNKQERPAASPTPTPQTADEPLEVDDEDEPVKVETNLVTVPVIASD